MIRATLTITSVSLILAGCSTYSPSSQAAREFATQKETVCCFVGMKNLPDETGAKAAQTPDLSNQLPAARAAQTPDLSGQLDEARRNLASKEIENADLARQLAAAKAAQRPDLSSQLDEARRNLASKESENADLARQLAAARAKGSENAEPARQNAAMREAKDKQSLDIGKALAEKGSATLHGIFFDFNKSIIKPESENALRAIEQALKSDPSLKLEIQGHTDSIGTKEYNQRLSLRRAEAVKNYVVEHYGIAADRLSATGYGETMPAEDNKTAVGRAHNRRVELIKK